MAIQPKPEVDYYTDSLLVGDREYSARLAIWGSGGEGYTFIDKIITQNGEYNPISDGADAYSGVSVNVSPTLFRQLVDRSIAYVTKDDLAGLTKIGLNAFQNCASLYSIDIPSTITAIDSSAFQGCTLLPTITIPSSVETFGSAIFQNCQKLKSIIFEENSPLSIIPLNCCTNCIALESIIIPKNVRTIAQSAFSGCTACPEVIFEEDSKLEYIGFQAFIRNLSLTNIILPATIMEIYDSAFMYCESLESVAILADMPPLCGANTFGYASPNLKFYVPPQSSDTYKSADGWSNYANRIFPIQ